MYQALNACFDTAKICKAARSANSSEDEISEKDPRMREDEKIYTARQIGRTKARRKTHWEEPEHCCCC